MRLLIISYWYTPSVSPRAFRWSALAEHWAAEGHQVDVVTSWTPGLSRFEESRGVGVHRPGVHIRGALRSFGRWLRERPVKEHPGVERTSVVRASVETLSLSYRAARWVYDHSWKKVYWPDDAALWARPAFAAASRLARRTDYDAVVSVSLPFTDHLVAARLHRRLPTLRWIMDVGDPFCFLEHTPTNNPRLYRRLNYRVERRVFRAADSVAVTTPATRDAYGALFPESAAKIHVIPPILPPLEELTDPRRVFPDDGRIRLLFAGNLYRTIREPDYLLRLFKTLRDSELGDRLELHFLGNVRDCWSSFEPYREMIDHSIFLHGTVTRGYALQAMRQAAALVNIGNATAYQLPSKVVEYASLGRPVLNLVGAPTDSSARFFADYPAALTVVAEPGDAPDEEVTARVLGFLREHPEPDQVATEARLAPYRLEAVAAAYEQLIHPAGPPRAAAGSRDPSVARCPPDAR